MLYDTRGRIGEYRLFRPLSKLSSNGSQVYLGDCAAPAFLQHLQGLLESELRQPADQSGFSKLTAIEEMPLTEARVNPPAGPGSLSDLQDLVDVYFVSVSSYPASREPRGGVPF